MLIESTQRLIRIASLVVATAMFTGMWANDVPTRIGPEFRYVTLVELAEEELPVAAPVVSKESQEEPEWEAVSPKPVVAKVPAVSEDDDGWIAIDPFEKLREGKASPKGSETIQKAATLPVSRTVDHDGLTLPAPAVQLHVELLPQSLPNGDYRIIDEFGGVGWLMIRGQQNHLPVEDGVWTTTIDGKTVRFIRVAPQPDRVA